MVVVATSNTLPDDLFKGQPGRDAFLPFIALIKQNLDVLVMEAGRDYRRDRLRGMPTWYVPADARAARALDAAFAALTGRRRSARQRLLVMGRTLVVPVAAAGVARFDFAALCGAALGAGDYLALATHFHAWCWTAFPRSSTGEFRCGAPLHRPDRCAVRHRVKLVASAAGLARPALPARRDAKVFERTASRLAEMQSQEYLALPHLT